MIFPGAAAGSSALPSPLAAEGPVVSPAGLEGFTAAGRPGRFSGGSPSAAAVRRWASDAALSEVALIAPASGTAGAAGAVGATGATGATGAAWTAGADGDTSRAPWVSESSTESSSSRSSSSSSSSSSSTSSGETSRARLEGGSGLLRPLVVSARRSPIPDFVPLPTGVFSSPSSTTP